ncbi:MULTISPECIES: hypothetical protein [unclassified Acinetobacter]|uniref:hypothetical protein n=1 Tax=unclassified Acinetobacter TaxID=196816 RepID=UPI0015D2BEBD|nr:MULTISPECIES: hypothetical protein [unclassified Acinetobacter]
MNQGTHVGLARPRRDLTEATAPESDCSVSLLPELADCSAATLGCSALRSRLVSRAIAFVIDSFELSYIAFSFSLRRSQPSHAIVIPSNTSNHQVQSNTRQASH